jgi:hypothetical protein
VSWLGPRHGERKGSYTPSEAVASSCTGVAYSAAKGCPRASERKACNTACMVGSAAPWAAWASRGAREAIRWPEDGGVGCRRDGAPATCAGPQGNTSGGEGHSLGRTGVEGGWYRRDVGRRCRAGVRGRGSHQRHLRGSAGAGDGASQGERAGRRLGREPPQKGRMSLPGRRRGSRWRTNLGADSCGVEGVGVENLANGVG